MYNYSQAVGSMVVRERHELWLFADGMNYDCSQEVGSMVARERHELWLFAGGMNYDCSQAVGSVVEAAESILARKLRMYNWSQVVGSIIPRKR